MKFSEKVYMLISTIPQGKVTTYKAIGEKLGLKAYRAVGQVLRCNPNAPVVPCHRVVSSTGSIGGFRGKTSGKEIQEKISLLESESVVVNSGRVDLEKFEYFF
jgi:methylated-DNA-[protein]-cysteine S-methyltransferase